MGGKRWQALHRLIYFSATAGVIHYTWLVKADLRKPLQYASVLAVLMVYRVVVWAGAKAKANPGVMAGAKMRVTEN
jgi:sulfoxide reductase heme-binding subunit YedZ